MFRVFTIGYKHSKKQLNQDLLADCVGEDMPQEFFEICQSRLSLQPWLEERTRRLPGINPLDEAEWLLRDDAFDRQMAYRDYLIDRHRSDVLQQLPACQAIAEELLQVLVGALALDSDYCLGGNRIRRPDGRDIKVGKDHPLADIGRLVQEDFCLLQRLGDEHVLVGAILCFPASWLLSEKLGHPLTVIHHPVAPYTRRIATGVQRILDNLRLGQLVFRANFLTYADPDLHQPRSMSDRRDKDVSGETWIRVERQTLRRLPATGAIVFGIHTSVCRSSAIPGLDMDALEPHPVSRN